MTVAIAPAQRYQHSVETQQRLVGAPRYNRWICDLIEPYITGRVLDIGSAIGNITQYFLDREFVASVDIEQDYVDYLNNTFGRDGRLEAHLCDASDPAILDVFEAESFDSAMCLNVIEHIPDHRASWCEDMCRFGRVAETPEPGCHDAADHDRHCVRQSAVAVSPEFTDDPVQVQQAAD